MTIKEITNQADWANFHRLLNPNSFLQSWEWGQVQTETGENIIRLGFFNDDQIIGAALIIIVNAKRGRHYLIPHGPVINSSPLLRDTLAEIVSYCRQRAKKDHVVALRIAPLLITTQENIKLFHQLGFRPAPIHVHAELTWVLDIEPPADQLLGGMRKTTRHAIMKAKQAGVTVELISEFQSSSALDRFMSLYQTTKNRHNFVPFKRHFISSQLKEFARDNHIFIAIARYEDKDVVAAICVHYGSTVFYHHGASVQILGKIPASQLLQWTAIKEAKRRGAKLYNFWGIAPANKPHHPFKGITTFKQGFGGYAINYIHAQDLPLSSVYLKLWLIDSYRKLRRGF